MEDTTNHIEKNKRTTFLTVLCIITYVRIAIFSISLIWCLIWCPGLFFPQEIILESTLYICLLAGTLQMWNLKKRGFYIYVMAELIPTAGSIIQGNPNFITEMSLNTKELVSILFIILYAINLKHME